MGKKKDLPAMPFYIGDWKKDLGVQALTYEERGIWFEMICLMWESEERGYLTINGKKIPEKMLEKMMNLDNQRLTSCLTYFEELGLFSRRKKDKAIYSRKIINIIELSKKRSLAGKKGGNPKLLAYANTENENEDEIEDKEGSVRGGKTVLAHLLKIYRSHCKHCRCKDETVVSNFKCCMEANKHITAQDLEAQILSSPSDITPWDLVTAVKKAKVLPDWRP